MTERNNEGHFVVYQDDNDWVKVNVRFADKDV